MKYTFLALWNMWLKTQRSSFWYFHLDFEAESDAASGLPLPSLYLIEFLSSHSTHLPSILLLSALLFAPAFHQLFMEGGKDQSTTKKKSILVGPWGGNGGTSWDDGIYNGVREITLVYDRCIDSIHVVYDKNGKPVTAEKHGGTGGSKIAEIKLQYPEEYLISVSGHYCPVVHGGSPVIRSLTFKSNKRTFGPYGVEEGTPFTLSMDGASIVGLMGRGGWYLDALSFRLSRVQSTKLLQKVQKRFQRLTSTVSRTNSMAN